MYEISLSEPKRVFFCGIGGISMSGLAEVLLDAGFIVSGSDRTKSPLTDNLEKHGAKIFIGQEKENITKDIDVFVYTAAIHEDHPEFVEAIRYEIPTLSRAELLGQIMKNYKLPIAISGTHGKTTVTSMISEILMEAEMDPTLSIGGILDSIGGNIRIGHSDVFVTEACEYTNSFLNFYPKATLILNVEEDHLDFFKDIDDIRNSFHKFALLTPEDGVVIIGGDIPEVDSVLEDVKASVVTFGKTQSSDYYATNIFVDEEGLTHFTVNSPYYSKEEFVLGVPGEHNVLNALASIALGDFIDVDRKIMKEALKGFGGAKRRFEKKGVVNGIEILDDYAHHPSEIEATLKASKSYPHKKLWVAFQPHTYTRTNAFLKDFAKALSLADGVILADIYAAREKNAIGITSKDLLKEIEKLGTECYYFETFEEIEKFILKSCAPGDLLITMGAGNIVNVGEDLLKN